MHFCGQFGMILSLRCFMNGIFPQKQRNKLTKLGVSQQSGLLRNDGRFVRGFFPLPGACSWVVFSRDFAILPPPIAMA